jgi:hypothetical protein
MQNKRGVSSVLELAKWKPGDRIYCAIFRQKVDYQSIVSNNDEWAFSESVHPKVLYKYKIIRGMWDNPATLPKLHACDFMTVLDILTSELVVEPYDIISIMRCQHTGEFIYADEAEEYMPESCLFSTAQEAEQECDRIKAMIRGWVNK